MKFVIWFLLVVTLAAFPLNVLAQDTTLPTAPWDATSPLRITEVTAIKGEQLNAVVLTIKGEQVDGCNYPLRAVVEQDNELFFVDLERTANFEDIVCASMPIPFEIEVLLDDVFKGEQEGHRMVVKIVVNDSFGLELRAFLDSPSLEFTTVPLLMDVLQLDRFEMIYDAENAENPHTIKVFGSYPNSCPAQTISHTRVFSDEMGGSTLQVRLYRFIAPDMSCLVDFETVEHEIPLDGDFSGSYNISVQGMRGTYDFDNNAFTEMTFKSRHIIDSVDVLILESFPPQVSLDIKGSQPDGCRYPVEVTYRQSGNTLYVEIFRYAEINAICPMMLIYYDETLNLGTLPDNITKIDVNGVIVDL